MIFGITGGSICAGRASLANYLEQKFKFKKIDLFKEFMSLKGLECIPTTKKSEVSEYISGLKSKNQTISNKQDGIVNFFNLYAPENRKELSAFINSVLDKCRADWQNKYVVYPLPVDDNLQNLIESYRLILVGVEGSPLSRFQRAQKKYNLNDLESFLKIDDFFERALHSRSHGYELQFTIVNNHASLAAYTEHLSSFNFNNQELLRPSWDTYFMKLAHVASTRTNCMKRAVGAVIVQNNRIVATGYNGTPFGMQNCNKGGCQRCNSNAASGQGLDECLCMHAEENAVIEAGRAKAEGATVYVTTQPCLGCAKTLVQSGVKRIVYDREYPLPQVKRFIEANEYEIKFEQLRMADLKYNKKTEKVLKNGTDKVLKKEGAESGKQQSHKKSNLLQKRAANSPQKTPKQVGKKIAEKKSSLKKQRLNAD